jgi:UDP-N-acetylglucosamine 1-carboxyvinyltransferase
VREGGAIDAILVRGNGPLRGTIPVSGSKNAALPILTAAILFDRPVTLENVPELRDIDTLLKLLSLLGVRARREGNRLTLDGAGLSAHEAPYDLVRKMRASIYVLGPLLARLGRARVSLPGGCAWGPRPVDLHIMAMEKLGAKVEVNHGYVVAEAPAGGLRGATVHFPISSVGATCNAMLAAVRAKGTTVLENAAIEPEVDSLAEFLAACGAPIRGIGTRRVEIEGTEKLVPAPFAVIPDRIEAGTFLAAAAITGGDLKVTGCRPDHLDAVLDAFRTAGSAVDTGEDFVRIQGVLPPRGIHLTTAPYPGFPTDMQAQMMALASVGSGVSVITDTIYADRFTHVAELARLGADIKLEGNVAVVRPGAGLSGARVMASDLRASAALIVAGLVAEGTTHVSRVYHIDRGYERIEEKLRAVGADIERIQEEGP